MKVGVKQMLDKELLEKLVRGDVIYDGLKYVKLDDAGNLVDQKGLKCEMYFSYK